MKILQISTANFPKEGRGSLYSDLAYSLTKAGHSVTAVVLDGKSDTFSDTSEPYRIIRVASAQIFNVGLMKKALSFFRLPFVLCKTINDNLKNEKFDLILFEAPPVTLYLAIRKAMKRFGAKSFLMQKDIFPQNAVDLGLFSKFSIPYLLFRYMEKQMLETATFVGCMSQGNIDFIRKHNPFLPKDKVVYFPNTQDVVVIPEVDKSLFRKKYAIPEDACVFIFSGNMGRPQNIPFLQKAMLRFKDDKRIFFVAIGSGTEAEKLKSFIENENFSNAHFFNKLPRYEYEKLASNCDVGIVSLDPRFTIPNYPSKTLSYMNLAQPILAATDTNTDYRDLIHTQAKCGLWSDSSKLEDLCANMELFISNPEQRIQMGLNGRRYLESNFSTKKSVEIIERLFS